MKSSQHRPLEIGEQSRAQSAQMQFFDALGYQIGREIQVVVGKNKIYRAHLTDNGLVIRQCRVVGKLSDGGNDWQPVGPEIDGQLLNQPLDADGVFFRPNRIEGGILNQHFQGSNVLFYEIDDRTLEEQKAALERFTEWTGLKPVAIVFSGGKSLHVYFLLSQELGAEDWKRLMRKLCVVHQSDPTLVNLNRAMRLPGALRLRDRQWVEQSLISTDPSAVYTPTQFEAALDRTELFPFSMNDARWKGWQRDGKRHDSCYLLDPDQVLFPPKLQSTIVLDEPEEALILEALSHIPLRTPGQGFATNYYDCLAVLQALNSLYGATKAEAIAESWSPSIPGTSWNIAVKIRSFGNKRDANPAAIIFGIAKRHGFRFPQRQHRNPYDLINDPAYQQYIAVEQERDRCVEAEVTECLYDRFSQLFETVRKPKQRKQRSRVAPIEAQNQTPLLYVPGCLPQYQPGVMMPDYLLGQMSDRNLFVYEAITKGWRNILDSSGTGSGKSHYAGLLEPELVSFPNCLKDDQGHTQKAITWYLLKESRYPSTCTVEANFELLPVRHNGMEPRKDEQGNLLRTPLGYLVMTPKFDPVYPDQGNCKFAHLFQSIGQKNCADEGDIEATNNPVCKLCPHNVPLPGENGAKCANHSGEGYGFRKERRDAMGSERLRLNPLSAPAQVPQNLVSVWEEITTLVTPKRFVGTLSDVNSSIGMILNAEDGVAVLEKLSPLLKELQSQLNKPSNRWGCTPEMFRQRVDLSSFSQEVRVQILQALEPILKPSLSQLAEIDLIDNSEDRKRVYSLRGRKEAMLQKFDECIARKEKLESAVKIEFSLAEIPTLEACKFLPCFNSGLLEKVREYWGIVYQLDDLRFQIQELNLELLEAEQNYEAAKQQGLRVRRSAKSEAIRRIEKAPNYILWDFLNVLFFDGVGTFRIHKDSIVLTLPGSRSKEIVQAAGANLFLDATIGPQLLKAQLGIDNLIVCKLDQPEIKNQRHIQISGFGNCGRDRAKSTNNRLSKLYPAIRVAASVSLGVTESDLKIAIADYKNVSAVNSDLQHLSNTRGSNKITGYEVLIVHGLPKPNQGALEDEYACIPNPEFTFEQYYQARCDAEIQQLAGRQRVDRYPNCNFIVCWITEEVLPFETERIDAIEICYDAAPTGQKTARSIFEAMVQCVRLGWKLTQKLIAQLAECTQGYISQWFAARGGWNFWKNLLKGKQPEDLEQYRSQLSIEERTMTEVLPLMFEDAGDNAKAVIDTVDEVFQAFGAEAFARIWRGITRNARDRFIAALLAIDNPRRSGLIATT